MVFHLFDKNITILSRPLHHSEPKYVPNITTMEGLSKEDDFPEFQRGLEVFNDNEELPPSLSSSCLALVAEQEICSNPPTSAALPSPNKKCLLE
jgi:hypothetical protein